MANIIINRHYEKITRKVELCGTTDIMFDRYAGDNETKLEAHQKLYLHPQSSIIGLPSANIMSFLSAHNTNSAPKRLRDARKFKKIANANLSFVRISEQFIPFHRDGKPIVFDRFIKDFDESSKCYVHYSVARLEKGIPNPKIRPVLPAPWGMTFHLEFFPNKEITEQELANLFVDGGVAIGLGTFRGVYGKFEVVCWE